MRRRFSGIAHLGASVAMVGIGAVSVQAAPPTAAAVPRAVTPAHETRGPLYKPSSKSPAPVDISTNPYGAFSLIPNAPKIGDNIADFVLPSTDGPFRFEDARKKAEVVLIFYRGDW